MHPHKGVSIIERGHEAHSGGPSALQKLLELGFKRDKRQISENDISTSSAKARIGQQKMNDSALRTGAALHAQDADGLTAN